MLLESLSVNISLLSQDAHECFINIWAPWDYENMFCNGIDMGSSTQQQFSGSMAYLAAFRTHHYNAEACGYLAVFEQWKFLNDIAMDGSSFSITSPVGAGMHGQMGMLIVKTHKPHREGWGDSYVYLPLLEHCADRHFKTDWCWQEMKSNMVPRCFEASQAI